MKDLKSLLKEAREAIKNKDFETSLKLSKTILKEDKSNYMALVFMGLSLQEVGPREDAPKAFKKAVEYNSDNPLAWNGLINFYEKFTNKETKNDLIQSYMAIMRIEINDKKILEYCEKLSKLAEPGDLIDIIKSMNDCLNKFPERKSELSNIILDLCDKLRDKPADILSIQENCLFDTIKNNTAKAENYMSYITLLYNKKRYSDVFRYAEQMHSIFENDPNALLWICKVFNQLFVEEDQLVENYFYKAQESCQKLLVNEPNNVMALFTKGIRLFKENKLVDTKDILIEVTTNRPGLVHAWVLLTKIFVKLSLFDEAFQASSRADKLLKSFNYSNSILKNLLDQLNLELLAKSSQAQNWQAALNLLETTKNAVMNETCLKLAILANISLERFDKAGSLISSLQQENEPASRFFTAKCYHKQGEFQKALDLLEKSPIDESEWWLEIGSIYWDLEEFKKCLVPFLKAAKCDPNNYLAYLALGNFYQKFDQIEKARRCYEKAFKINPKSKEIGAELSKMYRKEKNWEASQNILQSLTTNSDDKKSWAWLNLGLSHLEQGDYSKAIENLQKAVRMEADNPVACWEALADAYLARGSYTSALKCFQICQELASGQLYASLQVANIQKILGQYSEARKGFDEILVTNGQYVPALKGLAEIYICQAKECFINQRLGTARDHLQQAFNKLTIAVQQRNDFSCLWKLLGDICLFVAKLPEKYCCLFVLNALLEEEPSEKKNLVEKNTLFELASTFYLKAVHLLKENVLLWHDLGTSYLNHALAIEDPEKKKQLLSYAMAASQHCVQEDPNDWKYWNLMGTIAMARDPPNYALAQHAFIKAVSVDHNSAISWANLGVLYLLMGNIQLANKAFSRGQRSDPNYLNSWIGQALIAEDMKGMEDEAMDLLRHSTQLGQHQQGGIGYGHWVCKTLVENPSSVTLYSIQDLHAVPVACDALTWYIERNPNDGCAWNLLGILRERMGLKQSAVQAFKNAYRLAPSEHKDKSRINYGRILSKMKRYPEAIELFQEVEKATFNSGSGLALALFKHEQFQGSYSAYEQALTWLTEEQSSQSDLLVALGSIAYMFQGVDVAKVLLFQSIQLKPASSWGFYATLSLALLHNDMQLANLVLNDMNPLKDNQQSLPHYAILLSYVYSLQNQHEKAVKEIITLVHCYPNNASVWLTLCHLLLEVEGKRKFAASACAQVAIKLGRTTMDVTKVFSLGSLAFILVGDEKQAKVAAQKAIHSYPNIANSWAVLFYVLTHNKKSIYSDRLVRNIGEHIENLQPKETLKKWIRIQMQNYAQ